MEHHIIGFDGERKYIDYVATESFAQWNPVYGG